MTDEQAKRQGICLAYKIVYDFSARPGLFYPQDWQHDYSRGPNQTQSWNEFWEQESLRAFLNVFPCVNVRPVTVEHIIP